MNWKIIVSFVVGLALCFTMFPDISDASSQGGTKVLAETIGDIEVTAQGEFPRGCSLSVSEPKNSEVDKTLDEVERNRKTGENTAYSATYDIKIVTEEGEEYEPSKNVDLSFKYKSIDDNLKAKVYHTDENFNTESLETETKGNTVSTQTESFSYFTVEFYYEDKEYSIKGGGVTPLSEILKKVGLSGNIESAKTSDKTLFSVSLRGKEWVLNSYKAFDTNEWLKVTIDGIEYKIAVTDDYIDYQGNVQTALDIEQGRTDDDFTEDMHIATIFIDEDVIFRDEASRNGCSAQILYNGQTNPFIMKNVSWDDANSQGYPGSDNVTLSFDTSVVPLLSGQDNYFAGDVYSAKFVDGAAIVEPYSGDRTNYDVIITYKNMHINVDSDSTGNKLNLLGGNAMLLGHEYSNLGNYRFGLQVDINIQVVDKQGNPIVGTFYYPMVDLDVYRGGTPSFGNIYGASDTYSRNYSEQVVIKGGLAEGKIWIPGGTGQQYKSYIEDNGTDGLLISASTASGGDDNTFYTGFATLVDNTNGLDITYRAAAPANNQAGIETYLMAGKNHINWMLKSTTGQGGQIQTTRYGNHNGQLDDGGQVYGPSTLTVATGQSVVYTMTPNPGYRLAGVTVNRNTIDIDDSRSVDVTPTPVDSDGDGVVDYYTFSFDAIKSDGAIHVEWEKTVLAITKKTIGSGDVPDTFTFEIKAWNPNNESDMVDFSTAPETNFTAVPGKTGVYRFTLTNNQTLNISSETIPAGWKWQIDEVKVNDKYGTEDGWRAASNPSRSGILPTNETTQDVSFTNTRKKTTDSTKTLKIKKVWEDDVPQLRPDKITMTLESTPPIGVSAVSFGSTITSLVTKTSLTGIKYGSKDDYDTATFKTSLSATNGTGEIYFYRSGGDVYFYSDSPIYWTGSTYSGTGIFQGCTSLTDISGLEHIHTDFVTSFENLFFDAYNITSFDALSGWNTANVTNMAKAFGANSPNTSGREMKYTDLSPFSDWQMQNVTNIRWMFRGAKYLSDVSPIANWDTGRVLTTEQMFFRTSAQDTASSLVSWNMQSCTNFNNMFQYSASQGQGYPAISNLPLWGDNLEYPRPGSWNTAGTYTPSTAASQSPEEYGKNDEAAFWQNNSGQITLTNHDIDENDDNVWIYEVEVPESLTYTLYETIPGIYASKYDTKGALMGESLVDGKGLITDKIEGVSVQKGAEIHNVRKTRDVVLKITWDDENNALGLRPSAMRGNIDYKVGAYDGQLTTTSGWQVNGNVWTKTFKIPTEASVPDWGQLLPSEYSMSAKTHADNTNVYELVNTLKTHNITVSKNVRGSLGDLTKEFKFTAEISGLKPNWTYGDYTSNADGKITTTFKLKDDESWSADGFPKGCIVKITESSSDHKAQEVTVMGGNIVSQDQNNVSQTALSTGNITVADDINIGYTNTRDMAANTGTENLARFWYLILMGIALLMVGSQWKSQRERVLQNR